LGKWKTCYFVSKQSNQCTGNKVIIALFYKKIRQCFRRKVDQAVENIAYNIGPSMQCYNCLVNSVM
jgi:hypothetical protein